MKIFYFYSLLLIHLYYIIYYLFALFNKINWYLNVIICYHFYIIFNLFFIFSIILILVFTKAHSIYLENFFFILVLENMDYWKLFDQRIQNFIYNLDFFQYLKFKLNLNGIMILNVFQFLLNPFEIIKDFFNKIFLSFKIYYHFYFTILKFEISLLIIIMMYNHYIILYFMA